jgi:hypothetical protein
VNTRRERRLAGVLVAIPMRDLMGEVAEATTPAHVLQSGEYVGRHRAAEPRWPASDPDAEVA